MLTLSLVKPTRARLNLRLSARPMNTETIWNQKKVKPSHVRVGAVEWEGIDFSGGHEVIPGTPSTTF